METAVRRFVIALVAILGILASAPAFAQTRVYTNADLGRPLERTVTVTPEQLASLATHQFRLPASYPGPQVVIIGHADDLPFGPFMDLPPIAPLSNGPYWFGPSLFYGGPFGGSFLRSGRQQVRAPLPQQPTRPDVARRGRR
jgi:hypothetical protein